MKRSSVSGTSLQKEGKIKRVYANFILTIAIKLKYTAHQTHTHTQHTLPQSFSNVLFVLCDCTRVHSNGRGHLYPRSAGLNCMCHPLRQPTSEHLRRYLTRMPVQTRFLLVFPQRLVVACLSVGDFDTLPLKIVDLCTRQSPIAPKPGYLK